MSPIVVYDMLHRRPFRSFTIHLNDGAFYTVNHPEQMMIGLESIIISVPSPHDPRFYQRTIWIDTNAITQLIPETAEAS